MKLDSAQVERTLSQFQGEAIPDNHPSVPQLNNVFGEHTFFLDRNGLSIVEPASAAGVGSQWAKVVKLANWSEANPNRLEPHQPEPTDIIVTLGSKGWSVRATIRRPEASTGAATDGAVART
jgi:hypothetical protein